MDTSKKKTRKVVLSLVSVLAVFTIIGLIAFSGDNSVSASQAQEATLRSGTMTSGGYPSGTDVVRKSFKIHQDKVGEIYNDLHFVAWQKEGWIKINGWTIAVTHFTKSSSSRTTSPTVYPPDDYPGEHAVRCDFWGADIPYCTWLTIDITFWLSDYNTIRIHDMFWTKNGVKTKTLPNPGISIGTPISAQTNPANVMTAQSAVSSSVSTPISTQSSSDPLVDAYLHEITFSNDGTDEEILITGLKAMISPDNVASLDEIDFSNAKSFGDITIAPGESAVVKVFTDQPYWDNHLYLNYDLFDTSNMTEPALKNNIFDHPVFKVSNPQ